MDFGPVAGDVKADWVNRCVSNETPDSEGTLRFRKFGTAPPLLYNPTLGPRVSEVTHTGTE